MTTTARPQARVATAAARRQLAVIASLEAGDDYDRIRVPLKPPRPWFEQVPAWYTPPPHGPLVQMAVTGPESGRVACLVAPYTECILDGKQGCWKPGMSKTGYEYAHVGYLVTAEGDTIRTANVGGGINHFNPALATEVSLAADHYANTATRRMVGRYVDVPDIGIMFLGMLYPGTTHEQAFECMTSALSGDWRWVETLGDHDMVGSQLVNNPGFRPLPHRPVVLASVSFHQRGHAVVASASGGCDVPAAIISEWTPLNDVVETVAPPSLGERIAARFAGLVDALTPVVVDAAPMLEMPEPGAHVTLDHDDVDGEDYEDELAELAGDECRGCRGQGCERCGWLGYTGPDDHAVLAALDEAHTAAVSRVRRDRARDGDGDGFVYDSTPRMRPVIPGFDLVGESVSRDIVKRAASGDGRARADIVKRSRDNLAKARKNRSRPDRRTFVESTLGERPSSPAEAREWDEAARIVTAEWDRAAGRPTAPRPDAPRNVVDEAPARRRSGDDGEQLDLFAMADVDPEPMPPPRSVTIDGETEVPDEGAPDDLSGQTRILTPAERDAPTVGRDTLPDVEEDTADTSPLAAFRESVAKLADRETAAEADPQNGMAGMRADTARGRRDRARFDALASGYTEDQLDAVEANERARQAARAQGDPVPDQVDPPAPGPRETPKAKAPTPERPADIDADPPADVADLLDRFRRSTPDRQPAPFTPDEIRAIARWEQRNDGPEWLDRIENGTPKVYVTTEVDGRNYYKVGVHYVIESPDGKEIDVPDLTSSRIRIPKDRIPGGPDADYRRGIAEKWATPGVEVRTFHRTAGGRKEDAPSSASDAEGVPTPLPRPAYSLRPGPNGSKLVYNENGSLIGDVRQQPDGAWTAHDGDSGRNLGRFASADEAARAVARNKATTPLDAERDTATPDAPEAPTVDPVAERAATLRARAQDAMARNPYDYDSDRERSNAFDAYIQENIYEADDQTLIDAYDLSMEKMIALAQTDVEERFDPPAAPEPDATEAPTVDPEVNTPPTEDRVVPSRGGFGKLPDGAWGAKLDPNSRIPEARTEAGAEPREGDNVTLVNRAGKRTNAWLTEEVSPGLWRFSTTPPDPQDGGDPDAPPKFPLTDEQQNAVSMFATGDDLLIEAGAGAGKTATLVAIAKDQSDRRGLYLAFNRALVDEAATRMPRNVEALGFHQLAYRSIIGKRPALKKRLGGKRLARKEEAQILGLDDITVAGPNGPKRLPAQFLVGIVMGGIGKFAQSADDRPNARHVPFVEGIDEPGDFTNNRLLAKQLVPAMLRAWEDLTDDNGTLQFKHDHYLKMWQLSDPKLNADFIMLDEAQDMSPVLRETVLAQRKHGTQLAFVGDPAQSIYGFTGAEDAMRYLSETGAPTAQLTKSFRFGPEVARVANLVLDHLEDSNLRIVGHDPIDSTIGTIDPDDIDAILTRTNAKAVTLALDFMAEGKKVAIADNLKTQVIAFAKAAQQMRDFGYTDHPDLAPFTSWDEVEKFVDEDVAGKELELMVRLVNRFGADTIERELSRTVDPDQADISLSTAHTSKGREWDNVQIADDFPQRDEETGRPPDLSPDEARLLYVAVTRAKKRLDVDAVDWLFDGEDGAPGQGAPGGGDGPDGLVVDESQVSLFDDGSDGLLPFADEPAVDTPEAPAAPAPAPGPAMTDTPEAPPDVPEAPVTAGTVDWGTATARRASGSYTTPDGTQMGVDVDVTPGGDADVAVKYADTGEVVWSGSVPRGDSDDGDVMARARTLADQAAAALAAGDDPPSSAPEPETPAEGDWREDPRWKRAPLEGRQAGRRLQSGVLDAVRASGFKIGNDPEVAVRDGAVYAQYDALNDGDGFIGIRVAPRMAGANTLDLAVTFATPGNTFDDGGFELPLAGLDPSVYAAVAAANPDLWDSAAARQAGGRLGDVLGDRTIGGEPASADGWSMIVTANGVPLARHDSAPDVIATIDNTQDIMWVKDPASGTEYANWWLGDNAAVIRRIANTARGGAPLAEDNPFTGLVERAQSIADDPGMGHAEKVDALALEGQALREAMLASLPATDWHTSPVHVRALTDYGRAVQAVALQRAVDVPQGESSSEYRRHTDDALGAIRGLLDARDGGATSDDVKSGIIADLFNGLDPLAVSLGGSQRGGGTKVLTLRAQDTDGTWVHAKITARRSDTSKTDPWSVTIRWKAGVESRDFIWEREQTPSLEFTAPPSATKALNGHVTTLLKSAKAAHRAWQLDPKDADGNRIEAHPSDITLSTGVTANQAAAAAQEVLDRLVPGGRGLTDDARRRITVGTGTRTSTIRPHRDTVPLNRAAPGTKKRALLEEGLAHFPTSWIDGLGDYHFAIKNRGPASSTGTGGSNSYHPTTMRDAALLDVPSEGAPDTVAHELGHSFERVLPGLLELTVAHMDQRLDPDEEAQLLAGFVGHYGYHDEIRDEYAKKVYMMGGNRRPTGKWRQARQRVGSTEYLTTAMETLVPGSSRGDERHLGLDPERDGFIFGALILFDPQAQQVDPQIMPGGAVLVDAADGGEAGPVAGPAGPVA